MALLLRGADVHRKARESTGSPFNWRFNLSEIFAVGFKGTADFTLSRRSIHASSGRGRVLASSKQFRRSPVTKVVRLAREWAGSRSCMSTSERGEALYLLTRRYIFRSDRSVRIGK